MSLEETLAAQDHPVACWVNESHSEAASWLDSEPTQRP